MISWIKHKISAKSSKENNISKTAPAASKLPTANDKESVAPNEKDDPKAVEQSPSPLTIQPATPPPPRIVQKCSATASILQDELDQALGQIREARIGLEKLII